MAFLTKSDYLNPVEGKLRGYANNPYFDKSQWEESARSGNLQMYMAMLDQSKTFPSLEEFKKKYNYDFASSTNKMSALYNEAFADRETIKEHHKIVNGQDVTVQSTDYDFYKDSIVESTKEAYEDYLVRQDRERKNNMNLWAKIGAGVVSPFAGLSYGVLNQIDNISNLFAAMGTGVGAIFTGKNPFDEMAKANKSGYGRVFQNAENALVDFEKEYTYIRDVNGEYTTVGRVIDGVTNTIGQMIPSFLAGQLVSKLGAGSKAVEAVSSGLFYGGVTARDVQEQMLQDEANGISYSGAVYILNSTVKSAMQWAVEKGLDKLLGPSDMDKIFFGRQGGISNTTTKGILKFFSDANREGVEEFLQDYSDVWVNRFTSLIVGQKFGEIKVDIKTLLDSYVLGALTSIVSTSFTVGIDAIVNAKENKRYKLNPFAGWQYRMSFDTLVNSANEIAELAKANKATAEQVTAAYAAMRVIASVHEAIGDDRFKAAQEVLTFVQNQIVAGTFDDTHLTMASLAIIAALSERGASIDNEKALKEKIEKAEIADAQPTIVTRDSVDTANLSDKGKQSVQNIFDAKPDVKQVAITETGSQVVTQNDVAIVPKNIAENQTPNQATKAATENDFVDAIVNAKFKGNPVQRIWDICKKMPGQENISKEDAVRQFLYNDTFTRLVIMQSDQDMYYFAASLKEVKHTIIGDSKNSELEKLFNTTFDKLTKLLTEYAINFPVADEHLPIFDEATQKKIRAARYCKNLAQRIITNATVTEKEWAFIKWKIDNLPIEQAERDAMYMDIRSSVPATRRSAMNKLSGLTEQLFIGKYNGVIRMPETSVANNLFNQYADDYNIPTIASLNDRNTLSDEEKNIVATQYDNNVLEYRKEQFHTFTNNEYELVFKNGQLSIVNSEGTQVGFNQYDMQEMDKSIAAVKTNLRAGTHVEEATVKNKELLGYINQNVGEGTKAVTSIDSLIKNPELLAEEHVTKILKEYGINNEQTRFLYLRDKFVKDKKLSITIRDGRYVFTNLSNMSACVKKDLDFKSINISDRASSKSLTLRDFVNEKYLTERSGDCKVVADGKDKEFYYNPAQNVIHLPRNYKDYKTEFLKYVIAHEFQHVIQIENRLSLGLDERWLEKLPPSIRSEIIADLQKTNPELFEGLIIGEKESIEKAQSFVYYGSGEYEAYGLEGSTTLNFYPIVVFYNKKSNKTFVTLPSGTSYPVADGNINSLHLNNQYEVVDDDGEIVNFNADDMTRVDFMYGETYQAYEDLLGIVDETSAVMTKSEYLHYLLNFGIDIRTMSELVNVDEYETTDDARKRIAELDKSKFELLKDVSKAINYFNPIGKNVYTYDDKKRVLEQISPELKRRSLDLLRKSFFNNVSYEKFLTMKIPAMRYSTSDYMSDSVFSSFTALAPTGTSVATTVGLVEKGLVSDPTQKLTMTVAYVPVKDIEVYLPNSLNEIFVSTEGLKHTLSYEVTAFGIESVSNKQVLKLNEKYDKVYEYKGNDLSKRILYNNTENTNPTNLWLDKAPVIAMDGLFRKIKDLKDFTNIVNSFDVSLEKTVVMCFAPNLPNTMLLYFSKTTKEETAVCVTRALAYVNDYGYDLRAFNINTLLTTPYENLFDDDVLSEGLVKPKNASVNRYMYDCFTYFATEPEDRMSFRASDDDKIDKTNHVRVKRASKASRKYVGVKEYKGTNLEKLGWVGKNKYGQMQQGLRDFIANVKPEMTELYDIVDNRDGKKQIRKVKSALFDWFRNNDNMTQEEFDLFNNSFYHNENITSLQELEDVINIDKLASYYALRALLARNDNEQIREAFNELDGEGMYEKALAFVTTNADLKERYDQIVERYQLINPEKTEDGTYTSEKTLVPEDVHKYAKHLFMTNYDGSLYMSGSLASIIKWTLSVNRRVAGVNLQRVSLDADDEDGLTLADRLPDEETLEGLAQVVLTTSEKFKLETIKDYLYARLLYKNQKYVVTLGLDTVLRKVVDTVNAKLKDVKENYQVDEFFDKITKNMSAEEIERYYTAIYLEDALHLLPTDKVVDDVTNSITPAAIVRRMRSALSRKGTIGRTIEPAMYDYIARKYSDYLVVKDGKLKLKDEAIKTQKGNKWVLKSAEELQDVKKVIDEIVIIAKAGGWKNKVIAKRQEKARKTNKEQFRKALDDLVTATKEVRKPVVEIRYKNDIVRIDTSAKEVPPVFEELLKQKYKVGKVVPSETKGFTDEFSGHYETNVTNFIKYNAEILNAMTQEQFSELADFLASTNVVLDLDNADVSRMFASTLQIMMGYVLAENRNGTRLKLTDEQVAKLEAHIEALSSLGGTILSNVKTVQKLVNPEKIIMMSFAGASGIELTEEQADRLLLAVNSNDVAKLREVKAQIYKELVHKYVKKTEYIDDLINKLDAAMQGDNKSNDAVKSAKASILGYVRNEKRRAIAATIDKYIESPTEKNRAALVKEIRKNAGLSENIFDKLWSFERMAMLSGPGTWIRNITSNVSIVANNAAGEQVGKAISTLLEKLSHKFAHRGPVYGRNAKGDKVLVRKGQYVITGTKVSAETKAFIKTNFLDNGYMALIKDGLNRFDIRKLSTEEYDDNISTLIAKSIRAKIFYENGFNNEFLNKLNGFVCKAISDDVFVEKAALRYFGKMLEEDKVDLSNGITAEVQEVFANAWVMAANDYMHKPNIITKLDGVLREKLGPAGYLMYKQMFPFAASSWNWFVESLNYTPIGLAKSIIDLAKLEDKIDKLDLQKQQGEKVVSSRFAEFITKRNIGKGVIGTVTMGMAFALVLSGLVGIEDDDDKYKLCIGNNVKIDISDIYGTQPVFIGISLASAFKSQDSFVKNVSKVLTVMFDDSLFSDFYNLFRYSDSVGDYFTYYPVKMIGSFIPNFVKYMSKIVNPNEVQYSTGYLGKLEKLLVNLVPFISYAFPKYIDPYTGQKQTKDFLGWLENLWNNTAPIDIYKQDISETEKFMLSHGITKSQLTGRYSVGDEKITLSSKEREKLNLYYGKLNKASIEELKSNKKTYRVYDKTTKTYKELRYGQMSDTQKAAVIDTLMSNNSGYAKIYVLTDSGKYKYYATESEYQDLRKLGITKNVYKSANKKYGFR